MPLTIMENVEPELEIGRDPPRLTNQSCVYLRKEKHHAPQEVPVVTLQEHCQETEPETNPKCEGVSGFPNSQQEDFSTIPFSVSTKSPNLQLSQLCH